MAELLPAQTVAVAAVTATAATTTLTRTKASGNPKGGAHGATTTNLPHGVRLRNKGAGNNTGSMVRGRAFGGATSVTAVVDGAETFVISPGGSVTIPTTEAILDTATYTVKLSLKLTTGDSTTSFVTCQFVDNNQV